MHYCFGKLSVKLKNNDKNMRKKSTFLTETFHNCFIMPHFLCSQRIHLNSFNCLTEYQISKSKQIKSWQLFSLPELLNIKVYSKNDKGWYENKFYKVVLEIFIFVRDYCHLILKPLSVFCFFKNNLPRIEWLLLLHS